MKSGIIVDQTTMQYGHSAPMVKIAWNISQWTKQIPKITPSCRPRQNQVLYFAPAKIPMPIVIRTANDATPINGLGKPKMLACGVLIIDPHAMIGLMSQFSACPGLLRSCTFSTTRTIAESRPIEPPITNKNGKASLRFVGFLIIKLY